MVYTVNMHLKLLNNKILCNCKKNYKAIAYETPVNTQAELVARIIAVAAEIRHQPDMLQSSPVRGETRSCASVNGRHFQQLL